MSVTVLKLAHNFSSDPQDYMHRCPDCNGVIYEHYYDNGTYVHKGNYCPNCGDKIEWEFVYIE